MENQIGVPEREFEGKRVCDGCTVTLQDGDKVTTYFSDTFWSRGEKNQLPGIMPLEFYCLDCYPGEVPIPLDGCNEGFYLTNFQKKGEDRYGSKEICLLNGSPQSEGYSWNPSEILMEFFPFLAETYDTKVTTMHTFDMFRTAGIDLRGFLKEDKLAIPEHIKDDMRQMMDASRHKHYQETILSSR